MYVNKCPLVLSHGIDPFKAIALALCKSCLFFKTVSLRSFKLQLIAN